MSREIGVDLLCEVFVANWVTLNRINYHKNDLVITGKLDHSFSMFQQIVLIICVEQDVLLIAAPWQTVGFDRHTHTYDNEESPHPL